MSFRSWVKDWIRSLGFRSGELHSDRTTNGCRNHRQDQGKLRKLYGSWVCALTQKQLKSGTEPKDIKVPADVPSCKKNLFEWLSQVVDILKDDKEDIVHCWEKTELLRAWDRSVQVEAFSKKKELFPNLDESDEYFQEDEDAGDPGVPFSHSQRTTRRSGWVLLIGEMWEFDRCPDTFVEGWTQDFVPLDMCGH